MSKCIQIISLLFVGFPAALSGCQNTADNPPDGTEGLGGGPAQLDGSGGYDYSTGGGARCSSSGEFSCAGSPSSGAPGSGGYEPGVAGSTPGTGGGMAGTGGGAAGSPTETDGGIGVPGVTLGVCAGANPPRIPPESFPSCPSIAGCNVSRCVPTNALPAGVPADLLGKCTDDSHVCVPDEYIKTYGQFLAKSCTSLGGVEGRCISTCVPQVNGLMDALPVDTCGEAERCAPCINPNDGTETGACSQGCDPGMSEATRSNPKIFSTCESNGRCVPKDIVPKPLLNRLTILTNTGCTDPSTVCAPVVKSQNLKYNFPSCIPGSFSAIGAPNTDSKGVVTQWGGCVPAWLAGGEALFLAQQTCGAGELCAPCHDPLTPDPNVLIVLEDPTGACPVPLPSDPSGGLPPEGAGGIAGIGGAPVTWGMATAGAAGVAGTPGSGGSGSGGVP